MHNAPLAPANGGLDALHLRTPAASGLVYLHGAHAASWIPAGHADVLWLSDKSLWSPGKPIRGGVPICFPWFGPLPSNPAAPAHGFARLKPWKLESVAHDTASLRLDSDDDTRRLWPHEFLLRFHVTFGEHLLLHAELTNTGATPFSAELALHSYFAVGDVRQISITGLEGAAYIDKTDARKQKTQDGPIAIAAETDRVYLNTTAPVVLHDPSFPNDPRRITIHKTGSADTVVWNPWIAKAKAMPDFGDDEWPRMVCIETANVLDNALRVSPGQTAAMSARIQVQTL